MRELLEQLSPGILGSTRLSTAVTLLLHGAYWTWRKHGNEEGCKDTIEQCSQLIMDML